MYVVKHEDCYDQLLKHAKGRTVPQRQDSFRTQHRNRVTAGCKAMSKQPSKSIEQSVEVVKSSVYHTRPRTQLLSGLMSTSKTTLTSFQGRAGCHNISKQIALLHHQGVSVCNTAGSPAFASNNDLESFLHTGKKDTKPSTIDLDQPRSDSTTGRSVMHTILRARARMCSTPSCTWPCV